MKACKLATAALALLTAAPVAAQAPVWDPEPWLRDLAQLREAIETKYANLEYLLTEREVDLAALWPRAEIALRGAQGDAQAMAVFDRIMQRIGDGHVNLTWPRPAAPASAAAPGGPPPPPPTPASFCRARGFNPEPPGVAPALSGYMPVANGDVLPAGTVAVGGERAGIVRIGKFEPGGSPSLCEEALAKLSIPLDQPCDDACRNRIDRFVYRGLTEALEQRLKDLRAAGAGVLVVDVAGNGGGSEWVQAVARMLSPRQLVSQRWGFVRGPHWVDNWTRTATKLREFARTARGEDRRSLLAWAAEADAARAEAERRCPPTGGCPWLGRAGYATGLVGSAPAGAFAGKEWAPWVFNAAQYPYRDGIWDGPVVVLVDDGTASAAEEFAALLQDNRVAIVLGGRTAGVGCGHTWGGTPTKLQNSGAVLNVPDCARFRADGSNEVRGVIPDLAVAWRAKDGPRLRARLLEAALPEAARRAEALHRSR